MDKTPEEFYEAKHGHPPSEATPAQMALEWRRLKGVQESKGFKPGWVAYQFKELFGSWPPTWRRRTTV